MKLIIISGSYPPIKDGMSEYTKKFFEECKKNIDKTILITSKEASFKDNYIYNEIKNWGYKDIKNIINKVNLENPSIIQLEYPTKGYKNSIFVNFLPLILKLKSKSPVILRYHEFSNSRLLRKIADIPLILFSDIIVTPSKYDSELLKKVYFFKHKKISYVPIGVNIDHIENEIISNEDTSKTIKIGYFGFVYKGKGLETIVDTLRELDKENIDYKMNFICEFDEKNEYQKRILNSINKYLSKEKINITGYLTSEQASKKISECDIFLLPFDDGLTLRRGSFFSIASHKKPIITTEGNETKDIFINNVDVLYSNTKDDFKDNIKLLLEDGDLRIKLSINLSKKVEKFSWNNIFNEMNKSYSKLMKN